MISFSVKDLIEDKGLDFEVFYESSDCAYTKIYSPEINRPGLQLVGYYTKFTPNRIQIIGGAEWHYLNELPEEKRFNALEQLFKERIPLLIFTRGNRIFDEVLYLAKEYDITLLRTSKTTTRIVNQLINFMDMALAPTLRKHGILLDIYGVGVLLTGDSGIGKSETAIDLIVSGHKLISDDSVIIKKLENRLIGTSPPITRHFMEIRGVGIIDVVRLFGIGAIMEEKEIELIIHLEPWDDNKDYDRLGIKDEYENILDVMVPRIDIPMRSGRNTSIIIEIATRNYKQKELGYNAALALNDRILESIEQNKESHQ